MSLHALAESLAHALKEKKWKLVTAESCTGGGLAYWITNISGSSEWFDRGLITYSDKSKEELLNVNTHTLSEHGAVSEKTAREMAEGALHFSQANVSVAITGIAGPGGGSIEKPVGTVWIAIASLEKKTEANVFIFSGDRFAIREQAIMMVIEKLLVYLSSQ